MKWWHILIGLFLFVIGSLIVSFILNPLSFDRLRDGFSNVNILDQNVNYTQIDGGSGCATLELLAQSDGISEKGFKERICATICSAKKLDYGKFECDKDHLICYCKDW